MAYAKPFEGGDIPKERSEFESAIEMDSCSENDDGDNKSDLGEDDTKSNNDNITEGYLYKIQGNKMKKIYFKLICKDLYYYKSKNNKRHKGIHNLSGVFIQSNGLVKLGDKQFYCFTIIFPTKSRKYYLSN